MTKINHVPQHFFAGSNLSEIENFCTKFFNVKNQPNRLPTILLGGAADFFYCALTRRNSATFHLYLQKATHLTVPDSTINLRPPGMPRNQEEASCFSEQKTFV